MGMGDEFAVGIDDLEYEPVDTTYDEEVEQDEQAIEELKDRERRQTLIDAYEEEWKPSPDRVPIVRGDRKVGYRGACDLLEEMDYTADDVWEFCEQVDLEGRDGEYVSALVEELDADDPVYLPDLAGVDRIGQFRDAAVVIDGDVGEQLGYRMRDSEVTVKGDAGREPGRGMKSGRIEIEGSAGEKPGFAMEEGELVIQEGEPDDVGPLLEDGAAVYVEDVGNVSRSMRDGVIYRRGDCEGWEQYYPPTDRWDQASIVLKDMRKHRVRDYFWRLVL